MGAQKFEHNKINEASKVRWQKMWYAVDKKVE